MAIFTVRDMKSGRIDGDWKGATRIEETPYGNVVAGQRYEESGDTPTDNRRGRPRGRHVSYVVGFYLRDLDPTDPRFNDPFQGGLNYRRIVVIPVPEDPEVQKEIAEALKGKGYKRTKDLHFHPITPKLVG